MTDTTWPTKPTWAEAIAIAKSANETGSLDTVGDVLIAMDKWDLVAVASRLAVLVNIACHDGHCDWSKLEKYRERCLTDD